MRMGFIGLGHIGKPLALHWARSALPMTVFDVAPLTTTDLVAAGASVAACVADLARRSEIIGICVRNDEDVEQLLYGAGGIFDNAPRDALVAIHSTVKHDSILRWHAQGDAKSIHIVDAAVTRGVEPGKFCYMVGASAALFGHCQPLLATGGNAVIHAGPVGAGIALKLCNNMMAYAAFIAVHEASRLAQAFGLDCGLLQQVGRANGVVTAQMADFLSARLQIAERGLEALQAAFGPHAALGKKDLLCALESADKLHVSLPGTRNNVGLIEDAFLRCYGASSLAPLSPPM